MKTQSQQEKEPARVLRLEARLSSDGSQLLAARRPAFPPERVLAEAL
ncbi:MAG TPA: hypothetical protein VNX60_11530 [Candidatus Acidoferrum sp.]|nr:hypothetical protein [Candidatus Acidoferrum sp.]